MFDQATIDGFRGLETPFYYYNMQQLRETLEKLRAANKRFHFNTHYAFKANVNSPVLKLVHDFGLGADCVSGNEIRCALEHGFTADNIVFAGVGKSDKEINLALQADIHCFNCESLAEMEVIHHLAGKMGTTARIAIRVNPNLDAKTHHYITTGKEENKFGIHVEMLGEALEGLRRLTNLKLIGMHMHVGSQVRDLSVFEQLCVRCNELQRYFREQGFELEHLNMGGGLGVDYENPSAEEIADFDNYFSIFNRLLERRPGQTVHFELGRSIVAQCGSLITRVLYVKRGLKKQFVVLDAGMTELIRPALYQSTHKVENLTSSDSLQVYDVVGPICESSDCFSRDTELPETRRGDIFAIRTAGAYGEVMVSRYNLRDQVQAIYSSEDLTAEETAGHATFVAKKIS